MYRTGKIALAVLLVPAAVTTVNPAYSQTASRDTLTVADLPGTLEQLLGESATAAEVPLSESLGEALLRLAEQPVDLNRADLWTLLQVPGMNLRLAQSVLDYRARSKPFESVEELAAVPGIGPATVARFRPFVTVGEAGDLRRLLLGSPRYWTSNARLEYISRVRGIQEPKEGYLRDAEEGGYAGSPLYLYQRVRYAGDHLSANLLLEKDPGETLPDAGSFDYRSWHLAVRDVGRLRMAVAGDYGLSFGQGLVLWNGGYLRKGAETVDVPVRSGGGVRPYTSAGEGSALHGFAATVGGDLRLSGFYSARRHAASERGADSTGLPGDAGYHRTPVERAGRERLGQVLYGGRLQWSSPIGLLGVTAYRTQFDAFIDPGDVPYQRERFRGREHGAWGVDWSVPAGSALFFGEAAGSANGGYGVVGGVEGSPDASTRLTAVYRNYGRRFQSLMGSGFGEGSGRPRNEEGFYLGVTHELRPGIELRGYMDQFYFPGPRFGLNRSSGGREWLGRVDFEFNRDASVYLQVRSERRGREYPSADAAGREVRLLGTARRTTWRLHLEYRVHPGIRLRTRLEMAQGSSPVAGPPPVDPDLCPDPQTCPPAGPGANPSNPDFDGTSSSNPNGFLIYQDLRVEPARWLTVDARLTLFDTPSWESRLYQFENNLLYVLSNELLYGRGQRFYLLIHLRMFKGLDLWARVGRTVYDDRSFIGSGRERIEGNRRTDLGAQFRLKF